MKMTFKFVHIEKTYQIITKNVCAILAVGCVSQKRPKKISKFNDGAGTSRLPVGKSNRPEIENNL